MARQPEATVVAQALARPGSRAAAPLLDRRAHAGAARGRRRRRCTRASSWSASMARRPSGAAERLPPEIFDLPVEKMREGYYTDAYFNHTRAALLADGRHPRVVMQVFQKKRAVLGGMDEAIAILKLCARRLGRARPSTRSTTATPSALGDGDDDRGRLHALRPPRDRLSRSARAPHAHHHERRRVVEAANGKPIIFMPARHDHHRVQTGDGYAAHVAGAHGRQRRSASPPMRRRPGGEGRASARCRTR